MGELVYGLIGRKLSHSLSVPVHRSFSNPDYRLIELEPDELVKFLRRPDIGGLNVTIPYKVDALALCDELEPEAAEMGAVNTVVRRGERLFGYNTDLFGLRYMLRRAGIELAGRKVLVLGSGGAGRMARYCSERAGAAETVVISRSGENNYSNLDRHADAQVIINATPVGMFPNSDAAPLSLERFPALEGVADLIYNPMRTSLRLDAAARGVKNTGGMSMLVAQAAAAEELFFGCARTDAAKIDEVTAEMTRGLANIVIVGMPGSGKSSIGRELGRLSGREVLETDLMVEQTAGMSIAEIFEQQGEAGFRRLERETVAEACKRSGCVVVTGGGAVLSEENRAALRRSGRVYEIVRDVERLATEGRPLSTGIERLREMQRERRPFYRAVRDAEIQNDGGIADAAAWIWRDYCANPCD